MPDTSQGNNGQAHIGSPVCTIDGKELGKVKDVQGKYIKVDAPRARDFWLSVSTIQSSDSNGVHLAFDAVAIRPFMLDTPGDPIGGTDSALPAMDERLDARRNAEEQEERRHGLVEGRRDGEEQ